jgi:hypothetical protein
LEIGDRKDLGSKISNLKYSDTLDFEKINLIPLHLLCQKGETFLLPLAKGGAAVQSLITHASEALGLWRRTVGRDFTKKFQTDELKQNLKF